MSINDFYIPEVPIPARILDQKRAAVRRAKRAASREQSRKKVRAASARTARKASEII